MNNEIIDWVKRNYITAFIVLGVFGSIVIFTSGEIFNRRNILKSYEITVGRIIKYHIFGDGPSRNVTYEYKVNGTSYTRVIGSPKKYYDECEGENIGLCSEKIFLVLYSTTSPNKSLIDLTKDVQDINNIKKPSSFANFQ